MKKNLRSLLMLLFAAVATGAWAQTASSDYLELTDENIATIDAAGIKGVEKLYSWDGANLVVSVYGAYQSANSQKWVTCEGNGSTNATWEAPAGSVFNGSTYYGGGKAATCNTSRTYFFKVTNCVSVSALVKSASTSRTVILTVTDEDGTEAGSAQDNSNTVAVIGVDGLDANKIYTVKLTNDNSSNSQLYEVAFEASSNLQSVDLSFAESNVEAALTGTFTAPELVCNTEGVSLDGVTYMSSDESVATVDENTGAVTLVGLGTTVITATLEGNSIYKTAKASYTLTVKDQVLDAVNKKFWNFSDWDEQTFTATTIIDNLEIIGPNSTKISTSSITLDGETFTKRFQFGGKSDLGKNQRIIHLKVQSPVNIKVYYRNTGAGRTLCINAGSLSGTPIAQKEVIAATNEEPGGILETDYEGGDKDIYIYCLNNQIDIYGIKVTPAGEEPEVETVTVALNSYGYATLYYSDKALVLPEGVTATTHTETGAVSVSYAAGEVIPAGEAVILKGEAGNVELTVDTEAAVEADTNNALRGSDEGGLTEGGVKYYMLSAKNGVVGFYWGAEGGAAFNTAAHKAYLAVSTANAPEFILFDQTATAIDNVAVEAAAAQAPAYNLAGQRVADSYRGVVIVNGKKMVRK